MKLDQTYQTSFLTPSLANRRREPRQRKGENWQAYCVRYETWHRLTFREKSDEERHQAIKRNEQFRERCLRSSEVFCYRQIEQSKGEQKPEAVFFWFGGEIGFPGPQSQYLNRAALDFMLTHFKSGKTSSPGRLRVSFGSCLGTI